MFNKFRKLVMFLGLLTSCWSFLWGGPSIDEQIKAICQTVPKEIGVAAMHIERGSSANFNGDMRFPMASSYKIPIILYCLSLVDQGIISLNQQEKFTKYDLRRYTGITPQDLVAKNGLFTVKTLIAMMLEWSDNAASDKILKRAGGGKKVTNWLREKGINGINVDRSAFNMCADFCGMTNLGDEAHCTVQKYNRAMFRVSKKNRLLARKKFCNDLRDTSTPNAMVDLLGRMYRGTLVSKSSTQLLLDGMQTCHWHEERVRKFLPKETKLWRKTGAMDDLISDVGIIELPKGKGHFAYAFFTNKTDIPAARREKVFARLAKTVFDYFCD